MLLHPDFNCTDVTELIGRLLASYPTVCGTFLVPTMILVDYPVLPNDRITSEYD